MYEAVRAYPDGESTVARYALTAREFGYDGIVVRTHGTNRQGYDRATIIDQYGIDVVDGVTIDVDDPERASGYVGNYRSDHTMLAVRGGSVRMNQFAVGQSKVDVLVEPMAGDGDINHVLAKEAAANGVRLGVDLGPVLRSSGGQRVQYLQEFQKLRELIDQFDVPYVVSATPRSHRQLRSPRDLQALGPVLGVDEEWIETGLAEWGHLAARNRERQSEAFIAPGVRRGRHETDS